MGLSRKFLRVAVLCVGFLAGNASAQGLEGVLMPGSVIEAHAKYENDCRKCHIPFNRGAQDRLCLDCHDKVAADVLSKRGYHGRLKPQSCRSCHTDHKGREARIVELDEQRFDHRETDFLLRGAHGDPKIECRSCHLPNVKHRDAPEQCNSCHKKDDTHKGHLGPACADCHTESNWKEARFDHEKTRFPVRGRHVPVKCEDCHKNNRFKDTPTACIACHTKDDKHKANFGKKCESCHVDEDWKKISFDHDADTKYSLRGGHRKARCVDCHTGDLYQDKLQTACIACHRKDDKHKATLGEACADCHTERNWTEARFDHAKTDFPLRGKHDEIECKSCHKSAVFKDAPSACNACHKKDDEHKGSLGEACGDCHDERNWKRSTFDHAKTEFRLLGKHLRTKCQDCHRDTDFKRTPTDCFACHKKDDVHKGQEGEKCGDCHSAENWKTPGFDHGRTRFPLTGRHLAPDCKKCHETSRFKDAKRDCVACHEREDKHKRRCGILCETCHNARDWKIWDFNHDRKTKFPLDGAHGKIDCYACHRNPVERSMSLPTACVSCHRVDDRHDGTFGPQCDKCHVTSSFRVIKRRLGRRFPQGTRYLAWLCGATGAAGASCGRGSTAQRFEAGGWK